MNMKNPETLDTAQVKAYIQDKLDLIADLKDRALFLASIYGDCIKIEIDVNPKMKSVKLSVKEFL